MEIWWSGTHRVEVYLPDDYAHEMCGVCGDFNSDPSNDLILGPKCVGDGEPGSVVRQNVFLHYDVFTLSDTYRHLILLRDRD